MNPPDHPGSAAQQPGRLTALRRALPVALLTALAYLAAGKLALLLAIPPGYASPLYPPAGLALAAVLVYGGAALPGVALGALLVNALLITQRDLDQGFALLLPLVPALGAALQAGLGARLVRGHVRQPLTLGEPRDVAMFFGLGALLACTVNASLSTAVLAATGAVPAEAIAFTWWTWWGGDTLGVLIATPLALTLIGRPRADWAPRRATLALPLLGITALLATGTVMVKRWDNARDLGEFNSDAASASHQLDNQFRYALHALEATRGLFTGAGLVSAEEFGRGTAPWLATQASLQALGYSQRVARRDLPAYEAGVAAADGRAFRVFDRGDEAGRPPAAADDELVAVRFIEPMAGNSAALGVNSLSVAAARTAIGRSVATDSAAASGGFRLAQSAADETGVVIYRALYRGQPGAEPAQRQAAFRGVVFATLRLQQTLDAAMRESPAYLGWCLVDLDPQASRRELAGPAGCADAQRSQADGVLQHRQVVALGGQRWQLEISARRDQVPGAGHGNAWLFSTVGLASAAALTALLLTVTGRTRRIEAAVAERTTELRREVAERERTASALRDSEQRFRGIFDHAPVGIAIVELDGRIAEANPRLQEMVGRDAAALASQGIGGITVPDDRDEVERALARLREGSTADLRHRTRLQHRDGPVLWVQMNWRLLRDAQGRPQRVLAVAEDITEHLQLQQTEQRRQLAEEANRTKNEFLSRMSHELRTPLNAMLGFAQLLELDRQPALAPHQSGWTAQVLQAGWHLLDMINDTLDLSRIEAGELRLRPSTVQLPALLQQCIAMVEGAAAPRGITLSHRVAADAGELRCDATRLRQVLTNLLSNAVKYNVDGGTVAVDCRRHGAGMLEIRVADSGLGLSPAQLAELFQPFNRLGRENGSTEGTGIGLAISRRLAELMGGSLEAEGANGQGATFVLRLPLADEGAIDPAPAAAAPTAAGGYRQRRVHYIEDNETNVEVMRGMLMQRPQLQLSVSMRGLDGLDAVRRQPPDLILLDMHLPDIDGLELLRRLRSDAVTAGVPVLVVSADATPQRIDEALAAGARQYLSKPLNLQGFLSLVDEVLGEG